MKAEKTEQSEREEKWGNSPDASDPYFMTFAKVEPEEKETGGPRRRRRVSCQWRPAVRFAVGPPC
jgi:hypothetical protein